MAGAWGSRLKASAMNCQVVTSTLKLRSYMSSPLPAHPRLRPYLIGNCGIRVQNFGVTTSGEDACAIAAAIIDFLYFSGGYLCDPGELKSRSGIAATRVVDVINLKERSTVALDSRPLPALNP